MKNAELALIALYLCIGAVLLAYFVVLDNAIFILCSFSAFAVISAILVFKREYLPDAFFFAFLLIVASILSYVGAYTPIFNTIEAVLHVSFTAALITYGISALVVPALVLLLKSRRSALYSFLALSMPLLFNKPFKDASFFAVNLGILGYYLLVSIAIALFVRAIIKDFKITKGARKLLYDKGKYFYIGMGILVILIPAWPYGLMTAKVPLQSLPSLSLNFNSTVSPGYLLLRFNSSKYSYLENSSLNNLRFYQNGTILNALIEEGSRIKYNTQILVKTKWRNGPIEIYFMPFYSTFDSDFNTTNRTVFEKIKRNANVLDYTLGPLREPPGAVYRNVTVPILGWHNAELYSSENTIVTRYLLYDLCTPGNSSSAILSLEGKTPISAFLLNGIDNFSNATVLINEVGYYDQFIQRFERNSYYFQLNETKISFNEKVPDGGCLFYVITAEQPTPISIKSVLSYRYLTVVPKKYPAPVSVLDVEQAFQYGYLAQGIIYLAQTARAKLV